MIYDSYNAVKGQKYATQIAWQIIKNGHYHSYMLVSN